MDNIEKSISLETAKNRLTDFELPVLAGTSFVYDIKFEDNSDQGYTKSIPLVKNSNGETILRYKNLMDKYYWLVNKFIPTCEYYKFCYRNGDDKWVQITELHKLRGECIVTFKDYDGTFINSIMVASGTTYTPSPQLSPSRTGYDFTGWDYDFTQPINTDVTTVAEYSKQARTVTFIYYVGTTETTETVTVEYGESVEPSDIPDADQYTGHNFTGWLGSYTNVTQDTTVTAQYSSKEYTVIFYVDNVEYETYDVVYGNTIEDDMPADPSKRYYSFSNWLISGTTTVFDPTTQIMQDYDLVAEFIPDEYTITFTDWDGSVLWVETNVTHDTILLIEDEPTRVGYTFDKWSWPDSNLEESGYTMTGFVTDTTVVAQYKAASLNAYFMLLDVENEWTQYTAMTFNYGGFISRPANPKQEDFDPYTYGIFNGWYEDSAFTSEFNFREARNTDVVVYGKWKNEFEVTFLNWDGTMITGTTSEPFINPQIVRYGEDAIEPDRVYILPNSNYYFAGWSNSITDITSDVTTQAVYSNVRQWVVTFVDGISGEIISTAYVADGSSVAAEDIPTPPAEYGYTFNYWDKSLTNVSSDITVTALYSPVSFTVTFVDYDENTVGTTSIQYLSNAYTPTDFTVSDFQIYEYDETLGYYLLCPYRFSGEYLLVGSETPTTPEMTTITGNTIFQAQYVLSGPCEDVPLEIIINSFTGSYSISLYNKRYGDYMTPADTADARAAIETGHPELVPAAPLVFYGLEDQYGNKYRDTESILLTEPMTFRLFYMVPNYLVQFIDTVDNTVVSTQNIASIETGATIRATAIPPAPSHANYEWDGKWYLENTFVTEFVPDVTVITNDTTLYAKYTRKFNIDIRYLRETNE